MRKALTLLFALSALAAVVSSDMPMAAQLVDACATKPEVLGLSRVVEIDTTGGPVFGGSHKANNFLRAGEIVLTFDDGPMRAYTRPVLKALAAHCTKATFFMVGRMAAADPAMVKEVAAAGHTIGSHTWSHQNLKALGLLKGRQEFELGMSAVSKAAGAPIAPFFRFPFLGDSRLVREHAKTRDVATFFIDVDSKDFRTRDPKEVHARILSELAQQGKGIILMHDIQPSTAKAIAGLLTALHDKGYKVVHMVPKGLLDTVANVDGSAEKAIQAKSDAAKAKPLSDRSVVWTMAPPDARDAKNAAENEETPQPDGPQPNDAKTAAVKPSDAQSKGGDDLPWLSGKAPGAPLAKKKPDVTTSSTNRTVTTPATTPAITPAKRPARRQIEELPWQMRVFSQ